MAAPSLSKPKLGDILRDVQAEVGDIPGVGRHQRAVLRRLSRCGTDEEGLVQLKCLDCGELQWHPMSCQDRHCPGCGHDRAEQWIQARIDEVLEVPYHHLTFAIPPELHPLCRNNPEELYGLFFKVVQQTLKAFAANSEALGGTPAFFCVLHTANRRLDYFVHIHVVMAAATFDEAADSLAVAPDDQPLFDVDELATAFRNRFLDGLRRRAQAGALDFTWKRTRTLADPAAFETFLADLMDSSWTVWTSPATPDVETTIRYLGRYIQRTAITNARIVAYDGRSVTFTTTDTKTRQRRTITLDRHDFIRRFAQHILPKGFPRVRFYGLVAPSKRRSALGRAKTAAKAWARLRGFVHALRTALRPEARPTPCCTACGAPRLQAVAIMRRGTLTILHPPQLPTPPPSPGRLQ